MYPIHSLPPELLELVSLSSRMGQNFAFGTVGGRCAAAQAAALRDIREKRLYKRLTPDWSTFCTSILKISKTQADLMIRLLNEFGPSFFEIQQLTRISPEVFRAIQPYIKDGVLHFNGDAVELIEENAEKVASAVAEVRAALPKPPDAPLTVPELLQALNRRCDAVIAGFLFIAKKDSGGAHSESTLQLLDRFRNRLGQLDLAGDIAD